MVYVEGGEGGEREAWDDVCTMYDTEKVKQEGELVWSMQNRALLFFGIGIYIAPTINE